jgi:hypothetical protein
MSDSSPIYSPNSPQMHPEKSRPDLAPFITQLQASLFADASDMNLRGWGKHIVQNDIALMDIVAVIHAEKKIATRFSWMLGGIAEMDPQRVFPVVTYLFSHRHEITIEHFERSLAKFFSLAGLPEEIEGEAVEALFQWLADHNATISTRFYAMIALDKFCRKQPELRHELRLILEEIAAHSTNSLHKKALEILGKG